MRKKSICLRIWGTPLTMGYGVCDILGDISEQILNTWEVQAYFSSQYMKSLIANMVKSLGGLCSCPGSTTFRSI